MRQIMKETELASRSSLRGERLFMPGSVLGERPVTTHCGLSAPFAHAAPHPTEQLAVLSCSNWNSG